MACNKEIEDMLPQGATLAQRGGGDPTESLTNPDAFTALCIDDVRALQQTQTALYFGPFLPSWEANATYANTGNAAVRYNSPTLFGGPAAPFSGSTTSDNTPPPVPAGLYQVYVDDKNMDSPALNKFLTTSGSPVTPIQLF